MNVVNKTKLKSALPSLFEVEDGAHRLEKLQIKFTLSTLLALPLKPSNFATRTVRYTGSCIDLPKETLEICFSDNLCRLLLLMPSWQCQNSTGNHCVQVLSFYFHVEGDVQSYEGCYIDGMYPFC